MAHIPDILINRMETCGFYLYSDNEKGIIKDGVFYP